MLTAVRPIRGDRLSQNDTETYGTAEIDHRGRLTIPKPLREEMNLEAGTEFDVIREWSDSARATAPRVGTVTHGGECDEGVFHNAGEALFRGDDS